MSHFRRTGTMGGCPTGEKCLFYKAFFKAVVPLEGLTKVHLFNRVAERWDCRDPT